MSGALILNPRPRTFSPGHIHEAKVATTGLATLTIGTAGALSSLRNSTDLSDITFTGTLSVDITVAGAGGLDAGAEAADTWYAVFVIWGPGVATAGLLSLSSTAPTLPVGYTRFRRVGWVRNDGGSDFIAFRQQGSGAHRQAMYLDSIANRQVLAAGAGVDGTGLAIPCATFIPPSSREGSFQFRQNSALVGAVFGQTPASSTFLTGLLGGNDGLVPTSFPCESDQDIMYTNLGVGGSVDVWVLGYGDDL